MRVPSLLLLLPLSVLLACDAPPADSGAATAASADGSPGAATNAAAAPRVPLPPDVLMLQRVAINDPGVIAALPAMSVLLPTGWTTTGGVVATSGPCAEAYAMNWQASSPDGRSTVSLFPTEVWGSANTSTASSCSAGDYTTARAYLTARVQRAFPGAQILDYREREDYTAPAAEYAQRVQQMFASLGNGTRVSADGGDVLFSYTQDGVEMRGMAGVSAVFYVSAMPNPMGGPPFTTVIGGTMGTYGATAPNGTLDFELVEAVRRSIVPNGEWLTRLFAIQEQRGQVAAQGTRERAAMIVAGGAAATKSNIESFQRMSGYTAAASGSRSGELYPGESTSDRMQRRNLEAIRGVDTYMDPVSNTPVQLDHTYGNAWRINNQDAYLLTKNPNFNPSQYGIEATQMKVIP